MKPLFYANPMLAPSLCICACFYRPIHLLFLDNAQEMLMLVNVHYDKAFDSVEHFAIFETLLKIGVHPTYIKILQNIYRDATARVHLDKHTSELFPIERGVCQGDPISPKLFTAAIEEVFQKSNLQFGIEIEGGNITDLRFADDVAQKTCKH